jgi:hypothetical protein
MPPNVCLTALVPSSVEVSASRALVAATSACPADCWNDASKLIHGGHCLVDRIGLQHRRPLVLLRCGGELGRSGGDDCDTREDGRGESPGDPQAQEEARHGCDARGEAVVRFPFPLHRVMIV